MNSTIYIVSGAPASGKSTALVALLHRNTPYVVFDIDWLAQPASKLAGSSIFTNATLWPAYNTLWFEILGAVLKNNRTAILFAPIDKSDLAQVKQATGHQRIAWLLLDCADEVRRERLEGRGDQSEAAIAEALGDAEALRQQIVERIDTNSLTPDEVAEAVVAWVKKTEKGE